MTLHQGIFNPVPCFSSMNPSFDTPGVTGLFSSAAPCIWNALPLNLRSCLYTKNSKLFSKLISCHRFSRTYLVVSVFVCCFLFDCALNTQPSRMDMCTLHYLISSVKHLGSLLENINHCVVWQHTIQHTAFQNPTFAFILLFSSLYADSCFFHSSTLDVLSCKAVVSLALLFFNVCSSSSHFLALFELQDQRKITFGVIIKRDKQ